MCDSGFNVAFDKQLFLTRIHRNPVNPRRQYPPSTTSHSSNSFSKVLMALSKQPTVLGQVCILLETCWTQAALSRTCAHGAWSAWRCLDPRWEAQLRLEPGAFSQISWLNYLGTNLNQMQAENLGATPAKRASHLPHNHDIKIKHRVKGEEFLLS